MKKKHRHRNKSFKIVCASESQTDINIFHSFATKTNTRFFNPKKECDLLASFLTIDQAYCYLIDINFYAKIRLSLDEYFKNAKYKPLIILIGHISFAFPVEQILDWIYVWDYMDSEELLKLINTSRSRIRQSQLVKYSHKRTKRITKKRF